MLKRLSVVAAIVGYCSLATAQSVSYRLLETDPRNYKPTVLCLDLLNCDTYHDVAAGYGVKLETVILGRIMPFVNFKNSWYDGATHHLYNSYPIAPGGLKNQTNLDAGAVLFLFNKVKKRPVRIILKSTSSGRYTFTHFTYVPSEVKRMFGVGGGIFYNRKTLSIQDDAAPFFKYKNLSTGAEVAIPQVGETNAGQPAGDAYRAFAISNTMSLYGGLHLRNIKNTVIRADGYGKRSNAKVVDVYFDVMVAPVVSVGNVKDIDGKEWKIVPQSGGVNHIGYKAGYAIHSAKSFGFYYYTEFGKRPGPVLGKDFLNNGSYITLGMGVSIGSGLQLNVRSHKGKKSHTTADKEETAKDKENVPKD